MGMYPLDARVQIGRWTASVQFSCIRWNGQAAGGNATIDLREPDRGRVGGGADSGQDGALFDQASNKRPGDQAEGCGQRSLRLIVGLDGCGAQGIGTVQ